MRVYKIHAVEYEQDGSSEEYSLFTYGCFSDTLFISEEIAEKYLKQHVPGVFAEVGTLGVREFGVDWNENIAIFIKEIDVISE